MKNLLLSTLIFILGININAQNQNSNQNPERVLEITNSTQNTISYLYAVADMAKVEIAKDGSLTAETQDILGENVLEVGGTFTFSIRTQTCTMHFVGQTNQPSVYVLENVNICAGEGVEITAEQCVANCGGAISEEVMEADTGSVSFQNNTGEVITHLFMVPDAGDIAFLGGQVDPTSATDLLGEEIFEADAEISLSHNFGSCTAQIFANTEGANVYYIQNANICSAGTIQINKENTYDYPSGLEEESMPEEDAFFGAGLYKVKNQTRKQIAFIYAFPDGADTSNVDGMQDYLGDQILNAGQSIEISLTFPSETTQFVAVFEDQTRMVVKLMICDGCPEELIFKTPRR